MAARAALAAFAACAFSGVAAIETVRGGMRARAAGAPPPDAATLAAAMGGKAPTVVRVEAGSALGDALSTVAGGADTYISAASLIIPESCSAAGTVAKVAGDAAPALRIVVALSGSKCTVGAWLPPSVTGVPAATTASVGACAGRGVRARAPHRGGAPFPRWVACGAQAHRRRAFLSRNPRSAHARRGV
jgi:hypothetical protein